MKIQDELRPFRLVRHALFQNVLSLYGVQVASYIVPLITIPYLARVLGANGWGLVAFAQSFGSYFALLGEYGFALSATREVARHRDNRDNLTDIFAGVLGAKTLLAAASVVVAIMVRWWIPVFREHPVLLWAGIFWALAQAFNMMWFFQGLERMRLVAALDVSAKALAIIGVFVLVRRPEDGWRVLVVQGSAFLLSSAVGLGLAYRELHFRLPTWRSVREALRMGWSMFLFRGSVSLYTSGNAFILGLFVSPQLVGYYAGAEKISKAFLGLLNPISQALYPRLSHLVHHARNRAARLAQIGVAVMGGGGTAMGALVFLLAPILVQVILGKGFAPAVPLLRILSLLIPLIAFSNVFGIQWMLPLGLDRPFNTIILLAGLINLGLAVTLATPYADLGMAWAVVIAETFVTGSIYLLLRSRKLDPFSHQAHAESPVA
ncbi:MAG: flippase [Candidatus Sulfotelmatobacter sp.]